jgi:hypothetical protein
MKTVMLVAAAATGLFVALVMGWLHKKKNLDFSKIIVLWILANATGWVWCSYMLAYLGAEEIAETLSRYVAVEIIATLATYSIKAGIENLSKYNQWPDRGPKTDKKTKTDL